MRRIAWALGIAWTLAGCGGEKEPDWFRYAPPDNTFALSFPEEPAADVQRLATVFGPLEMHTVALEVRGEGENDGRGFIVRYADLPARLLEREAPGEILDGMRDGMLGTIDGRLLEEREAPLGAIPGRSVRLASATGEAQVLGRIYLEGPRVYQIMSVGAPARVGDDEALRFLDSFELDPAAP